MILQAVEIAHLYISPGHNFFGHNDREPDTHSEMEVSEIECVMGRGIGGDRFFDFKDDYKGQITFFSEEIFAKLCEALGVSGKSPSAVRRNAITRGQDLNELIGTNFEVQGISFFGTEECRPCKWMNYAIGPGALDFLRGRGGLRARILSDGKLRAAVLAIAR